MQFLEDMGWKYLKVNKYQTFQTLVNLGNHMYNDELSGLFKHAFFGCRFFCYICDADMQMVKGF